MGVMVTLLGCQRVLSVHLLGVTMNLNTLMVHTEHLMLVTSTQQHWCNINTLLK